MALTNSNATRPPSTLARSPEKAQATYIHTLESAEKTHGDGEAAHRIAVDSLKHSFEKVGDHWEPRREKGPSDAQAANRGPAAARVDPQRPPAESTATPARPTSWTSPGGSTSAGVRDDEGGARQGDRQGEPQRVGALVAKGPLSGRKRPARSGPIDRRQDRLAKLLRLGELRPVAGRQVDVFHVLHGGELGDVRIRFGDPLPQLFARELARNDRRRHVVPAIVGEHLGVVGDRRGLGTALARNARRRSSSRSSRSASSNTDQSGSGISSSTTGSPSLMACPAPSGPASTYTTRATGLVWRLRRRARSRRLQNGQRARPAQ